MYNFDVVFNIKLLTRLKAQMYVDYEYSEHTDNT